MDNALASLPSPRQTAPLPSSTEAGVAARFHGPPDSWLDVDGVRVAYRRFGSGPDVLFVHGWPLWSATFRRLVPLLTGDVTCHLVDLPGTGATVQPDGWRVDFASHARVVRGVIDRLGLSRVALLAHDSGGVVARLVAADDPRVVALVLEGTEIPGHRPAFFTTYVKLMQLPGAAMLFGAMLGVGAVRRSGLGFGGCFTDPSFVDGDFHSFFVAPLLASRRVAEGQAQLVRSVDWRDVDALRDVHARIRVPVQLVWGSRDPFFPVALARAMTPQFGGPTQFREIAGAKLFAHEDHPADCARIVRPFLHEVLAAR